MLDSEQSKKVWYKLIEKDYLLEKITISAERLSYIEIQFQNKYDFDKFRDLIFNLMYIDISSVCDSTELTLFVDIDLDFLQKIVYPVYTKEINIFCTYNFDKIINLNMLPSELEKLIIISSILFDLTNLPNKLKQLDLSGCNRWKKFNLDYLPESLKLLKLASTDEMSGYSIYEIKDLENLPIGLNEIFIGNMFFKSVEDILQNYLIKKPYKRK